MFDELLEVTREFLKKLITSRLLPWQLYLPSCLPVHNLQTVPHADPGWKLLSGKLYAAYGKAGDYSALRAQYL